MIAWIALLAGLALICLIMQDAFEVMLLPRRVERRVRLMRYFFRGSWLAWRGMAKRLPAGGGRESFLGVYGALSMVVLFGIWAVALINAFGLVQFALQTLSGVKVVLLDQIYMSGTTFFTLGYGDVLPKTTLSRVVAVGEAGIGLGFLAVVIGYLPVLYQLFSRREAHVIQLDGRAGSPPTAATMICRHAESDGLDKLDALFCDWESWGAELLDSHLSYPMLAYYRSQHDDHSWLGGLAAVMDACAMVLVGVSDLKPLQARMTFAMARHVVMEMGRSLHVAPQRDQPNRLSHEDFLRIEQLLDGAGVAWNGGEGAEETLAALRATYEPMLHTLADYLLIPLPPWVAAVGEGGDHWEQGRRGGIASRLVEDLADRTSPDGPMPPLSKEPTMAGRLRQRLKRR
ncbi:MAG: potassium channel family protein [Caulobacteraceae bacterium]